MPRPNFFIVGGVKCGTTSLYEYLRQHPQVFMPDVKEPIYFGQDLKLNLELCTRDTIHHWDNYLRLFDSVTTESRIGEATVWYLYSERAAAEIYEFDPAAKIIIMVRNPVDVMYSLHGELLWDCNEEILDFREALAAQEDRRQGHRIPATAYFPQTLFYEEVVQFSAQIERFFKEFGRDAICVEVFDDFVADTAASYRRVIDYLEIDPKFEPDLRRFNESKPTQMLGVNRFFAKRPGLRRAINRVLPLPVFRRLRAGLSGAFSSKGRTAGLDPQLRSELQESMQPEVERLSELLGRDLTHWSRPKR